MKTAPPLSPPPNGARPFVFLDKSALLLDQPFNVDPARLRFAAGWSLAAERLYQAGFSLAVVSNESGIAFGYYDEHALDVLHRHVAARFASRALELAGFLYCPHHPEGTVARYVRNCDCHLPQPGLLRRAAIEMDADLRRSWLVGHSADDVLAARNADCRAMLVDSGHEPELLVARRQAQPYEVAPDLITAADLITAGQHAEAAA
ncbi:MAG: D-glycero-alpha-D-manno-heptose-1,7-bisphosphate 7-phosphatase [Gemmatimonadaceae bacterium]